MPSLQRSGKRGAIDNREKNMESIPWRYRNCRCREVQWDPQRKNRWRERIEVFQKKRTSGSIQLFQLGSHR